MPRIRTIKPEFQLSAHMGEISRDARLTFILLWPQCDDTGKIRGSSRMLASLLHPYDDDAPRLIEGWLGELERVGSIRIYVVDGQQYISIPAWKDHQAIDHPRRSSIPDPTQINQQVSETSRGTDEASRGTDEASRGTDEASRGTDEASCLDLGPRTKERRTKEGIESEGAKSSRLPDDWKPSGSLVEFASELHLDGFRVADAFRDYWRAVPGSKGKKLDWDATFRNWCRKDAERKPNGNGANGHGNGKSTGPATKLFEGAARAVAELDQQERDREAGRNVVVPLLDRR